MSPDSSRTSTPPGTGTKFPPASVTRALTKCGWPSARGRECPAHDPHVQGTVGLAPGDTLPEQARLVLPYERDQVAGGVEHRDGPRWHFLLTRVAKGVAGAPAGDPDAVPVFPARYPALGVAAAVRSGGGRPVAGARGIRVFSRDAVASPSSIAGVLGSLVTTSRFWSSIGQTLRSSGIGLLISLCLLLASG